jgi:23S rRNA pseudouridine2605 synthase
MRKAYPPTKQTAKPAPEKLIRLNKLLAEAGVASRRKADDLIASGVVKVNGMIVNELGAKASLADLITVNGDPIRGKEKNIYILLNKPKDCITTTSDELARYNVLDIVKKHVRIYPVGRLDRNTTGALLLTNDGELAYRLTHPKYEIERIYHVTLDKQLRKEDAKEIVQGVELDGEQTSPCELVINPKDHSKIVLLLKEGKNREVRRIFDKFGYDVRKLERRYFAGLSTSGLARGEYRNLRQEEIHVLEKKVGLR